MKLRKTYLIYSLLIIPITVLLLIFIGLNGEYELTLFNTDDEIVYFKRRFKQKSVFSNSYNYEVVDEIIVYDYTNDKSDILKFSNNEYITVYEGSKIITVSNQENSYSGSTSIYMYNIDTSEIIDDDIFDECLSSEVYCTPLGEEYVIITDFYIGYEEVPDGMLRNPRPITSQVESMKIYNISTSEIIFEDEFEITKEYGHISYYNSSMTNYVWYEEMYYDEIEENVQFLYKTYGEIDLDDGDMYLLYNIDLLNYETSTQEISAKSAGFLDNGILHAITFENDQYFHQLYDENTKLIETSEIDDAILVDNNYILFQNKQLVKYDFNAKSLVFSGNVDKYDYSENGITIVDDILYCRKKLKSRGFLKQHQTLIDIERNLEIKFHSNDSLPNKIFT